MPISSVIVEVEAGADREVMDRIAAIPEASVYGVKDNQIVTVIDGKDTGALRCVMDALAALENVIGVYPVYAGYDE